MNDLSINTYEFYTVSKTGILRKICMRNTKKKNSVRNTSILYTLLDEHVIVLLLII